MTVHYLNLPPDGHLWSERLAHAFKTQEVLTVVNDFIVHLDASDLGGIPVDLRPPAMEGAEQVAGYALDIIRHECSRPRAESPNLICRLALFFSAATLRLAQVGRKPADEQQRRA